MLDLQGYHHPVLDKQDLVAAGTAADFALFGPVPTGHVWMLGVASAVNDTGSRGTPILSLVRGGQEFKIDGGGVLTVNVPQNIDGMIYVPESCYIKVYVLGATALDVLHMIIGGLDLVRDTPGPSVAGA
jgi:hypothetical protein